MGSDKLQAEHARALELARMAREAGFENLSDTWVAYAEGITFGMKATTEIFAQVFNDSGE